MFPTDKQTSELPFVGRRMELQRIRTFIQGALSSDRLSIFWIRGDAGIGKSRLLGQALEGIDPSIIVVRARFYPDASNAVIQVIGEAVVEARRHFFPEESPSAPTTIADLLGATRVLARRRPTLLTIEDLHLIDSKEAATFSAFLHGLEGEPIGMICTTRPELEPAYGVALPFIVATQDMHSFSREDLSDLVLELDADPNRYPNLIDLVYEKTHGHPLAIWSIFRGINTECASSEENPTAVVRRLAGETTRTVVAGMTRALSREELRAAGYLALLGEIFAVRAATFLIDDAPALLRRLMDHRIITTQLEYTPPIIGTTDDSPLVFTHSLLRQHLAEQAPEAYERLMSVLESEVPLYSIAPFLHAHKGRFPRDRIDLLEGFVWQSIRCGTELLDSPYWNLGIAINKAAQDQVEAHRDILSDEEYRDLRVELLLLECGLYNAFVNAEAFRKPAEELLELTASPSDEEEAIQRLRALEFAIYQGGHAWSFQTVSVLDEMERVTEAHPSLRLHEVYLHVLTTVAGGIRASGSIEMTRRLQTHLDQILQATRTGEEKASEVRQTALIWIAPSLLPIFDTPEELEDRSRLAEEILRECGGAKPVGMMLTAWPRFLEATGRSSEAADILGRWMMPKLTGYDLPQQFALRMLGMLVEGERGTPLPQIAQQAKHLIGEFLELQSNGEEEISSYAHIAVSTHLIVIGVMRGDPGWGITTAREICGDDPSITAYMHFERSVLDRDLEALRKIVEQQSCPEPFREIVSAALDLSPPDEETGSPSLLEKTRKLLLEPIIRRQHLLRIRIVISLLELESPAMKDMKATLEEEIRQAITNGLEWLSGCDAPGYLPPLAALADTYLQNGEKISEQRESRSEAGSTNRNQPEGEPEIRLTMIGKITTVREGEKQQGIRGGRQQRLAGLLAANALQSIPLSLHDFRELATEIDDPDESANYLRILVARLRKRMGNDTVITDGKSAPRFDTRLVAIDLLDGVRLIEQGLAALENNNGGGAVLALGKVADMLAQGDLYPELEGEFFEAARKEYGKRLREAILLTIDWLHRDGGEATGRRLLEKGLKALPNDAALKNRL